MAAHSVKKTWLQHILKKTWLRHILEKMIDRAFGKKHDYNVFWGKTRLQYILCKLVEDQHWHLAQKVPIRRIVYPLKYKCCIQKEGRMVYNNHSKMIFFLENRYQHDYQRYWKATMYHFQIKCICGYHFELLSGSGY